MHKFAYVDQNRPSYFGFMIFEDERLPSGAFSTRHKMQSDVHASSMSTCRTTLALLILLLRARTTETLWEYAQQVPNQLNPDFQADIPVGLHHAV
jgi:hypothetical protein